MSKATTQVATARYFDKDVIAESGLTPVGSTVGVPKFSPGYLIAAHLSPFAPFGIFGKGVPEDEFRDLYFERLNSFGPRKLSNLLDTIAHTFESKGVVLLCYCKLEEGFCHRRMFAEWWEEETGDQVVELREHYAPALT